MATPIQYTPQFVQTDLGLLNNIIGQRDKEYDLAEMQQQQREDQFASLKTDAADIGLKNEIMGEYQKKAGDILERYGGDYAAAATDLAKLGSDLKANPFINLSQQRMQIAEEERKLESQLGSDAIKVQSVRNTPLRDAEGNWITPDQLKYKIYDRNRLNRMVQDEFKDRAQEVRTGPYRTDKNLPGYKVYDVTTGITRGEVPEVADEIYARLMERAPGMDPATAKAMAYDNARQMVRGTEKKQIRDYGATGGGDETNLPKPGSGLWYPKIKEGQTEGSIYGIENKQEYKDILQDIKDYAGASTALESAIESTKGGYNLALNDYAATNAAMKYFGGNEEDKKKELFDRISKKMPIVNQLVNSGLSKDEAINVVLNDLTGGEDSAKFATEFYAEDMNASRNFIQNDLFNVSSPSKPIIKRSPGDVAEGDTGDEQNKDWLFGLVSGRNEGLAEIISSANDVNAIGVDWMDGALRLRDNKNNIIDVPFDAMGNTALANKFNTYSNVIKAAEGTPEMIGTNPITYKDPEGNTVKTGYQVHTDIVEDEDGNKSLQKLVLVNPTDVPIGENPEVKTDSKGRKYVIAEDGKTPIPVINPRKFAQDASTDLFKNVILKPKLYQTKGESYLTTQGNYQ